jgi:hypothetical protein
MPVPVVLLIWSASGELEAVWGSKVRARTCTTTGGWACAAACKTQARGAPTAALRQIRTTWRYSLYGRCSGRITPGRTDTCHSRAVKTANNNAVGAELGEPGSRRAGSNLDTRDLLQNSISIEYLRGQTAGPFRSGRGRNRR